jgi:ribosomal protein S6--L-glutamate ligase
VTAGALRGLRLGFLCLRHPPGYRGSLFERLAPRLTAAGALVEPVHAEHGSYRLDEPPPWDLVVLQSESAAALHLAAAAEAWGIPSVNGSEATRLARDRLASAAILRRAGLPVPPAFLTWLGRTGPVDAGGDGGQRSYARERPDEAHVRAKLEEGPLIVKSARGFQGSGLWIAEAGKLRELEARLPEGPYLVMEKVPHEGEDLKVYVAGGWMAAIERPFPAESLRDKRGRPATIPDDAAEASREAGRLLGLTCYGCDFVRGPEGWVLVDVNAFPGYKGVEGAPEALAVEISRAAGEARR